MRDSEGCDRMGGKLLVTGGAGYIGSHTVVASIDAGYDVTVIDNFSNSSPEALRRVSEITGQHVRLIRGDLRDARILRDTFHAEQFDAVIHFAGLKAVGESVSAPLSYYDNNVFGALNLLNVMAEFGQKRLVFSSSATVYGDAKHVPLTESAPRAATNPYGRTKLVIEEMLEDVCASDGDWRITNLRYFNPAGAHPSGLIGEDPLGVPNNLMPYVAQVASGRRSCLSVFGGDYPTIDGTGVRDYIHVVDLAEGHIAALDYLSSYKGGPPLSVNLGTGSGISVLQLVQTFSRVSGRKIPYTIVDRRPGDVAECYADPSLAKKTLGWEARLNLEDMCRDAWNWQVRNPLGYQARESEVTVR